MPRCAVKRRRSSRDTVIVQKPRGEFTPRVQAVGPEHFGIVAVDAAKARSRWFLADFYGRVLIEPTTLPHTRGDFAAAIQRIRAAMQEHDLRDLIVAIERTGEYHRPVQLAFRAAGFETRLVHPYTSKQYRQPADPGNKTDDTDLPAIFRAATHGFGLLEPVWPDLYRTIQMLRRHRRDLVEKNSILCCQIREVLHAAMPGYAECFCHLWESPAPLVLARQTTSAAAVLEAGVTGLQQLASAVQLRCRKDTLHKIRAWAEQAPPGHPQPLELRRILSTLDDDRLAKTQQILELERELAHLIVRTPYALLLAVPGINIVTIADLAGELGPIELYANANAITGRAALMPSRYQSDRVDHANGPLRRRGNRRLRAVLMQTADNLVQSNHYFHARADVWTRAGKDPRWLRVKVVKIFSRLLIAMVGGRQLFPHPCCQPRHYLVGKLLEFHTEHRTSPELMRRDLDALIEQLPAKNRRQEIQPVQEQLRELSTRRRGPQLLGDILPWVLARLGVRMIQSTPESAEP
jgi:transposase